MATLKFALLLYLSLVLAAAASNPHRREHADLGRLLKKRTPLDIFGSQDPSQGQQAPSTSPTAQPTPDTSAAARTTPANSPSGQTASPTSAHPSTAGGGGLLSSLVNGILPTESSTSSSAPATPSSLTSSNSPTTPQTSAHASNTLATTPVRSILYLTSSSMPSPTQTSSTSSSAGISHAAITVLIIIAASVGASVIVWTIIRKWKFRPSSDFGSRMQPIDWQPGGGDENAGLPRQHRPLSRASSFHSGSGNAHDDQIRGPMGGYGSTTINPIPDHDFTAGPAHLAPVGGYADLARGLSPQPMMQESLGRAPTINRPMQYDQHGVPLYHGYNGY